MTTARSTACGCARWRQRDEPAFGIAVTRDELVGFSAEAGRAASRIGFPVVMKASGATLLHKSDRGLVRVGITSELEAREAYSTLINAAPEAEGVLEHPVHDLGVRE